VVTQRPFEELNLWQRIFAEHWDRFAREYEREQGQAPPEHWQENVGRMLSCGDIREGYYEYACQDCGETRKIGFTCKSRLCLRCCKVAVDDWLNQARAILFEGVIHRQVVLTVPPGIRPLVVAEERFLKAYMDAGARAIKELIRDWRPRKKIRVGIMAVLQLHGRAGNQNPHLHFVVSEGGVDRNDRWREVTFFDTRKLRKKWQYQVIMALKKAVRGTAYQGAWAARLGALFRSYPAGFDVHCMPESGPVDRLVVYLCKYVSSPPISIRRIEASDGGQVTYRYADHRRGEVHETVSAVEFIGRMIRHLPPKGFRLVLRSEGLLRRVAMVRYYGIYARPVRAKMHALVAETLKALVRRARQLAQVLARRWPRACEHGPAGGSSPAVCRRPMEERFGKGPVRCRACGSTRMRLMRIWSRAAGVLYDRMRDGPPVCVRPACRAAAQARRTGRRDDRPTEAMEQAPSPAIWSEPLSQRQMALAF